MKWALYIIFFISVYNVTAQTPALADTIKQAESVITQTVQPTPTDTAKKTGVQSIPTQTIAPITVKQKKAPKYRFAKDKVDFKRENKELIKLYKDTFERKKEIVLQNKRYRIYNNYLSAGVGKCYNSGWGEVDLCTAFDFNFHAGKKYFQVGGNLVGPALWNNNCIQLHAGWGHRIERCNYQLAAYGGLSFSDGYYLKDSLKIKMNSVGVYAALQAFYKLKFDYGIGLSTFVDVNAKQTLVGLKVELFFSGAYKGFKKINYAKEDEKYQVP
ncbi:MAG TPA: hypothetical protein VN698_09210 [Bacteroidia bacterium]|nr:hypothetical protein [Bacteroidia bacterium]